MRIDKDTMKILRLTVKRKWFTLIASGEKKEIFVDCTPYWEKRLLHGSDGEPNEYDEVHIYPYGQNLCLRMKCNGITLTDKQWVAAKHGERLAETVIAVRLGLFLG